MQGGNHEKEIFILSSLIFAFLFFTSTMAFAADNTMNAIGDGARNVVNGAENLVTKGVDATKNTVNDVSKGIGDTMNSEKMQQETTVTITALKELLQEQLPTMECLLE